MENTKCTSDAREAVNSTDKKTIAQAWSLLPHIASIWLLRFTSRYGCPWPQDWEFDGTFCREIRKPHWSCDGPRGYSCQMVEPRSCGSKTEASRRGIPPFLTVAEAQVRGFLSGQRSSLEAAPTKIHRIFSPLHKGRGLAGRRGNSWEDAQWLDMLNGLGWSKIIPFKFGTGPESS